mmetsp:Transcript_67772/g.145042  ORF Transcript_67772/g.145042 Transcript_67772/m.145042 type:complete len:205 (-) Transcript_67772:30-644(-)
MIRLTSLSVSTVTDSVALFSSRGPQSFASIPTACFCTIERANAVCPTSRKASPASAPAFSNSTSTPPGWLAANSVRSHTIPSTAIQRSPRWAWLWSCSKLIGCNGTAFSAAAALISELRLAGGPFFTFVRKTRNRMSATVPPMPKMRRYRTLGCPSHHSGARGSLGAIKRGEGNHAPTLVAAVNMSSKSRKGLTQTAIIALRRL